MARNNRLRRVARSLFWTGRRFRQNFAPLFQDSARHKQAGKVDKRRTYTLISHRAPAGRATCAQHPHLCGPSSAGSGSV
eukprot:8057916-Alexandrium_andersonii.AAC.1